MIREVFGIQYKQEPAQFLDGNPSCDGCAGINRDPFGVKCSDLPNCDGLMGDYIIWVEVPKSALHL